MPEIMVIRKLRSSYEVFDVIHGNINRDELYIRLMMNSDQYHEQLKVSVFFCWSFVKNYITLIFLVFFRLKLGKNKIVPKEKMWKVNKMLLIRRVWKQIGNIVFYIIKYIRTNKKYLNCNCRAKEEAKQRKEKMMATERQRLESERAESEAKRDAIIREVFNQVLSWNIRVIYRQFCRLKNLCHQSHQWMVKMWLKFDSESPQVNFSRDALLWTPSWKFY